MDNLALSTPAGEFGERPIWRAATQLVRRLLGRTEGTRAACIDELFSNGRSLGWLTNILRSEIFSHGVYGDRAQPEEQRLLSVIEFQNVLATMLARYRDTSADALMNVPDLLNVLYAWRQGGNVEEPKNWVAARIETDKGLIAFLSRVRGWVAVNNTVMYPLKRRDLENFLDFDAAKRRVQELASQPRLSMKQRRLVADLLTAFEQGADVRDC
jgi:hypothetical protein